MVKIGVMGAGYWGSKHLRTFHEMSEAALVMVCDRSVERLHAVRHLYPSAALTLSYEDLLECELDAVVIATPPPTHYDLAEQALLAGKHVLVEKPMTTSPRQAEQLIDLAAKKDLRLMVSHPYQYDPAVSFLRDYAASGELGELVYLESAHVSLGLFPSDTALPWEEASDDLSMITEILGAEPHCVSARRIRQTPADRLDAVHLEMLFPGKATAHAFVNGRSPGKVRRITLVGTSKTAVFHDIPGAGVVWIYDRQCTDARTGNDTGAQSTVHEHGLPYVPEIPVQDPLTVASRHFVECLQQGKTPRSSGPSALRVLRVLERAAASIENGGLRQTVSRNELSTAALVKLS